MTTLFEKAQNVTDDDIDALPAPLRWPIQFVLGLFFGALANGFWALLGTGVGWGVHQWMVCRVDGPACGVQIKPYSPVSLLRDPHLAERFDAFAVEAAVMLVGWLLINGAIQLGVKMNAVGRLATLIAPVALGLFWLGWYGFALLSSWM